MKKLKVLVAAAAMSVVPLMSAQAADATFSLGSSSESTVVARFGLQWDWDKSWWQTDTGRLTGYWDAGYTYWNGDDTSSKHSISFAPVFVYEFSGEKVRPYVEAGIGVALFSGTRVEGKELGSSFQFEDRIGAGLRFGQGHDVGIRAIHYSNAGIKDPNDGIEAYSLYYRRSI